MGLISWWWRSTLRQLQYGSSASIGVTSICAICLHAWTIFVHFRYTPSSMLFVFFSAGLFSFLLVRVRTLIAIFGCISGFIRTSCQKYFHTFRVQCQCQSSVQPCAGISYSVSSGYAILFPLAIHLKYSKLGSYLFLPISPCFRERWSRLFFLPVTFVFHVEFRFCTAIQPVFSVSRLDLIKSAYPSKTSIERIEKTLSNQNVPTAYHIILLCLYNS